MSKKETKTASPESQRCSWCGSDPAYVRYHDEEWGVPVRDDRHLFSMLILEGCQAGLSWLTILKRRETYRLAYDDWDAEKIARYTDADAARLKADAGIIRNRLKIAASITNAQAFLAAQAEYGTFSEYIWQFTNGETITRTPRAKHYNELPTTTAESDAMSKALKKRGFRFVGSTICYAYMQAVGMVDDHEQGCFRVK